MAYSIDSKMGHIHGENKPWLEQNTWFYSQPCHLEAV